MEPVEAAVPARELASSLRSGDIRLVVISGGDGERSGLCESRRRDAADLSAPTRRTSADAGTPLPSPAPTRRTTADAALPPDHPGADAAPRSSVLEQQLAVLRERPQVVRHHGLQLV